MKPEKHKEKPVDRLAETWTLPSAATLGSAVRAKGILLEIRARLPAAVRKSLDINGSVLTLSMPATENQGYRTASFITNKTLDGIEHLPVIPREIQDILAITATERHRWRDDGRLPSAGTRTVRLNGRARQITFHVFDPAVVMDILDRGLVDEWRVQDAEAKAENRRRAAWKAKLTRSLEKRAEVKAEPEGIAGYDAGPGLAGWEDFGRDGFLR